MEAKILIVVLGVCGLQALVSASPIIRANDDVRSSVHIQCTAKEMQVTVDMNKLRRIYKDANDTNLAIGDECYGKPANHLVTYQVCYPDCCHMTTTEDAKYIHFGNYINYQPGDRQHSPIAFELWRITLQCSIPKEQGGEATIRPDVTAATLPPGQFDIVPTVIFYGDVNFHHPINDAPLGTTVYVDVFSDLVHGLKMVTQTCIAYPAVQTTAHLSYPLISNRCHIAPVVSVINTTDTHKRFSMTVFHFPHVDGFIQVNCTVMSCQKSDDSHACAPCPPIVG